MQAIKKIFFYVFAVLYVSDVPFFFLPGDVRTRFFIGLLGMGVFFVVSFRKSYRVNKVIFNNLIWLLALLVPFVLTILINKHFDAWGLRPFLAVLVYFAAFFVIYLRRKEIILGKINFDKIAKILVNIVVINIIIAVILFFIPTLKDKVFAFQGAVADPRNALYYESLGRLFGIGSFFFYQGGVYCSWALIIVVYLGKVSHNFSQQFKWLLVYLFILISGIFVARTTFVGAFVSIIYYFLPKSFSQAELLHSAKRIFISLLLASFIGFFSMGVFKNWLQQNEADRTISHAFELFINLSERGEVGTGSTDHLKTMYRFPTQLKTWLIGDGIFSNEDGSYYMQTDVGYLRILYFLGILGIIVLYAQKLYLLFSTAWIGRTNTLQNQLFFFLLLFTLITNLKGFTDLDVFVFFFFWYYVIKNGLLNPREKAA